MLNISVNALPSPIVVTTTVQLQQCIDQLRHCDVVALDTEFMRTDTFFPILGLIQVYNGDSCWLIDPVAISDLSSFVEILEAPDIIKVFHSCSEDLEVIKHVMNCVPSPLFDTQVAAALCGYGFSKGYAGLVDVMLNIHVPKGETRSNWLKRPLSDAQLGYAALDVYHLLPIYRHLSKNITALDRTGWVEEEMLSLVVKASKKEDLSHYFLKVKGAWQLLPNELAALQLLCKWREVEARERDRPRSRVVSDKTLLDIVQKKPNKNGELATIEGMHPSLMRRYAETLLSLMQLGLDTPEKESPLALPDPLPKRAGPLLKKLKHVVISQADILDLPPEVLARKRDIEILARSLIEQQELILSESIRQGWRYQVVGKQLLAVAKTLSFE